MAREQRTYTQGEWPAGASRAIGGPSFSAHVKRVETAMSKIARALPDNAALAPVWNRLLEMHAEAIAKKAKETKAQSSARMWLIAQNEIPSNNIAMSASGKPAP